ncbi:MAG TPA: TAXI family TRAP transporter solute-binding subunit [Burkholderiales bacterium]|nr:TAXI family TRAP transporter solute-binding subunit [Burkholderiales bacterium]
MTDKTTVRHGTATPGGGFPVYGDAFAATLNEVDPTLAVTPTNTKGSTENVPMLEAGKLDTGQCTGEVLYEAISGIGRAPADVKILSAMYSNSGMFIVRANSPYKTIADLKGKPIAWGAAGSGFIVLARYVMDGLGLDMNKDFVPHLLEKAGDGPAMVLDGRAAALWGGGVGWPGFTAVSNGSAGARFIGLSADEIKRITSKYTFIKPITLPANSYPGQKSDVFTVGSWSFVLARTTLPDDTAYRLARALHKGETAIGKRLEQARESTLANTLAAAPKAALIHAGVQKYMREIALLK